MALVYDMRGKYGVCICGGWWPFFDFRRPTPDEIWAHRVDEQIPGVREIVDIRLSFEDSP